MFVSLLFCVMAFMEYAAVNYGMTVDLRLRAAEREAKTMERKATVANSDDRGGTLSQDTGVRLVAGSPPRPRWVRVQDRLLQKARLLKDLDLTMRWLFALTYLIYIIVMFSISSTYNHAFVDSKYATLVNGRH